MTTILLSFPIACFRITRFTLHLFYGLSLAIFYPSLSHDKQKRILKRWSAELIAIFNVKVSVTGPVSLANIKQGLIVANHISWLDVFILNSVLPMRFVAKSEVRGWPVIGWLCERAQTIFIERGKRSDTVRINQQAVESLQQGGCMAIFPEGTSTDGSYVRQFRTPLFQPAVDAQAYVYPIAIHYHDKNGKPNLDAAYIDDMTFIESLWNILCSRDLHVCLTTSQVLDSQIENRRTLAQKAHHQISVALLIEPALAVEETKSLIDEIEETSQTLFQPASNSLGYSVAHTIPNQDCNSIH